MAVLPPLDPPAVPPAAPSSADPPPPPQPTKTAAAATATPLTIHLPIDMALFLFIGIQRTQLRPRIIVRHAMRTTPGLRGLHAYEWKHSISDAIWFGRTSCCLAGPLFGPPSTMPSDTGPAPGRPSQPGAPVISG